MTVYSHVLVGGFAFGVGFAIAPDVCPPRSHPAVIQPQRFDGRQGAFECVNGDNTANVDCEGWRPVAAPQQSPAPWAQDEPEKEPCASSLLLVYPGLDATDVKEIQAEVDRFMAQVRAKCVKEEGA